MIYCDFQPTGETNAAGVPLHRCTNCRRGPWPSPVGKFAPMVCGHPLTNQLAGEGSVKTNCTPCAQARKEAAKLAIEQAAARAAAAFAVEGHHVKPAEHAPRREH